MKVLSVEASGSTASVSIVSEKGILGEINLNYKMQHSVLLMPMIEQLLKETALTIGEIDGFVVSKGPGSFTGLRIGMATVKGLALGSQKPVISVSSLDALAYNIYTEEGLICSLMDALRGNVYYCIYKIESGSLKAVRDIHTCSLEELIEELKSYKEKLYFVGDGATIHRAALEASLEGPAFAPLHLNHPTASSLGELGLKLLIEGKEDNLNTLAPIYLRRPQAEREYDKKMSEKNE
ncbi:tRNA (adenosine(37)-N6)-threonylcarbamoyltransferase complex dimerization subunit type 1 TsaB [Alloiococcus sp. CFN-8]|uniref:tRNA (adenosine(37)-N6)-threonylcarbamoyltransferase complex dimerization subunit type 1 TsaB n=1 Tax=Alloiococcus sp. CFN-8 TaxID=3416081 RepID=UPI003CF1C6DE